MKDQPLTLRIELTSLQAAEEARDANGEFSLADVRPLKSSNAKTLSDANFVDPVTAVLTITLAALAIRIVNHWLKSDEAGLQMDLRTVPPTISRLQNIPTGSLVIIDKNGKADIRRLKHEKPEDVINALSPFFGQKDQDERP